MNKQDFIDAVAGEVGIAYLRMSRLKHLPQNPLRPAASRD
jgi:hypothetical protein